MEPRPNRRAFLLGSTVAGIASVTGYSDRPETNEARRVDASTNTDRDGSSVAVVSQHHLATDAGFDVLAEGGTAADAAVAVACALSVVEPWFSSALGGGTWALYYDSESGEVTSVDGVGPVGSEATPEDYEARAGSHGMHQSIVPGAWDGWMLWLDRYGECDLETVLSPAVTLAREGYPVSPGMENWLQRRADRIEERPDATAIYVPDGELVEEGDTIYQHDMADTFESLVNVSTEAHEEGRRDAIQAARDHFYRGPIAEAIVAFSDEHDGYLTRSDFETFEAEIVDPISIEYGIDGEPEREDDEDDTKDVRVYQNPPNSQGITQLLALNVLEGYDLSGVEPNDSEAIHVQAEALKLAFAERYHHVGDPERIDVPVDDLLDDAYAADQRDRIELDRVLEWPIDSGLAENTDSLASDATTDDTTEETSSVRSTGTDVAHTSTFHVVDAEGNAAAVTTSLGAQFQVIGDTGIHLNNRMRMIAVEEDDPNRLTPGYKVRHTSNPYMATRDGQPYILGGNTGVDTQPQGQTQQFVHVAEFGLDAQEAIDRPRFETTAFPTTTYPYDVDNTLEMEEGFPAAVVENLEDRGHDVQVGGSFGTANMIVIDEAGAFQVGAESRSETADGGVSQLEE